VAWGVTEEQKIWSFEQLIQLITWAQCGLHWLLSHILKLAKINIYCQMSSRIVSKEDDRLKLSKKTLNVLH